MIAVLCVALLLGGPQSGVVGQITGAPPASAVRDIPKGTAAIKGKVVAVESGKAIRRVQIGLSSPDFSEARTISTTAQGVFEFKELPAGRYTLTATRPGFIRLQYGQRRPGEPGRPIQLAEGQRFADANFSLPRTGAIAGRITDELGDPMPDVSIYPAQWKYYRGKRRMVPVSSGGGCADAEKGAVKRP